MAVQVVVNAKAGNWLPGQTSPAYLDGSLPGDYGFDPLGLAEGGVLPRMREAEIINGRCAFAFKKGPNLQSCTLQQGIR